MNPLNCRKPVLSKYRQITHPAPINGAAGQRKKDVFKKYSWLAYRPMIMLLTFCLLLMGVNGFSQTTVTINLQNASLEKVFSEIKRQTSYSFFYEQGLLRQSSKVNVHVTNAIVEKVMDDCLKNQPLTYSIVEKVIVVKEKKTVHVTSMDASEAKIPPTINIKGRIANEKDEPIARATVSVKKANYGTFTNDKGEFELASVDANATLIVTSVGYETREIAVRGQEMVNAQLQVSVNNLDETVVVAYNTTTVKANTGAVTVIKGEQIQNLPNRSFDKSLQGLVPGLMVTNGTGQPGGGMSNFVLRGIATSSDITSGQTVRNPLIVIDGIPVSQSTFQQNIALYTTPLTNPLSQLNTSDIESISVLKDAAAIALYGSKASNGVLVITTKKGKAGKTVFGFRHQTDISTPLRGKLQSLNQQEYLDLLYETYRNTNASLWTDAKIKTDLISKFPTIVRAPGDTVFYPATDWYNELFKDHSLTVSNELSISGGSDKSNFYFNVEYTTQDGVIKNTGYDRVSTRFNFENKANSWLKWGVNSTSSYNVQDYGSSSRGSAIAFASTVSPLDPVRLTDGNYKLNYDWGGPFNGIFANPVASGQYNINKNTAFRGMAKIYGEINFLKYFKVISNLGVDFMLAESKEKGDPRLYDPGNTAVPGSANAGRVEEQDTRRANLITTNMLRFDKSWNNIHALNISLGQEAQVMYQRILSVGVKGLVLPYYDQISTPGVTILRQSGYVSKETLQSFFGQANYGFNSKYFLSASIRTDGSSRFGENKRYGTYWSTGAGWVISAEPFAKAITSFVDYLKIRGSIGAAGNASSVGALTRYDQLQNGIFLGGVAVYPTSTPGNPDIQWESTFSWDAGLEMRFFKKRISITADIYQRNTNNLVYSILLPANSGYSAVPSNLGNMENKGVELSLSADVIKIKDFRWNLSANWSTNQNKLVKAYVSTAALAGQYIGVQEGRNFGSYYMPRWAGVNPADGSSQWFDSTGKISSNYNAAKKEFVGNPNPEGFGVVSSSFSYKGFELTGGFYYQYGSLIYNADNAVNDGYYPYRNADRRSLDRWQKADDVAANPKRTLNNVSGAQISTRYLYSGDYIRLQNLSLAYTFPKRVIEKLRLSSLKVYVQGYDIAIWTKFPGQDPDNINSTGSVSNEYPTQKTYSVGLNANF